MGKFHLRAFFPAFFAPQFHRTVVLLMGLDFMRGRRLSTFSAAIAIVGVPARPHAPLSWTFHR